MGEAAEKRPAREPKGYVMLRGANVLESFRSNLFDAANRAGMTPNEYCLQAAAEKLKRSGREFSGIFHKGDLSELNGGMGL